MDCDPLGWVVHRPVVDAAFDDIDVSLPPRRAVARTPPAEMASFDAIVARIGDLTSSTDAASAAG